MASEQADLTNHPSTGGSFCSSVRTMIIPAAGRGTRMQGLTRGSSKEILCIGGRPAVLFALREALAAGIGRTVIVIRREKQDIVRAVREDRWLQDHCGQMDIQFCYQKNQTGEAGAIMETAGWLGDEPFAVHYPDNIIAHPPGTLTELIARQQTVGTEMVMLTPMLQHVQAPPCVLSPLGNDLYRLIPDRTAETFPFGLRPCGVYIATFRFLTACRELLQTRKDGEVKDRAVFGYLIERGGTVHGLDLSVNVLDVGNPAGYGQAAKIFQKKDKAR